MLCSEFSMKIHETRSSHAKHKKQNSMNKQSSSTKHWAKLTYVLKAIINKPFQESFEITFIGKKKNCQNINYFILFLSFSIKFFPLVFCLVVLFDCDDNILLPLKSQLINTLWQLLISCHYLTHAVLKAEFATQFL